MHDQRAHDGLVSTLAARGFVVTDRVETALGMTPREPFLHEAAGPLAAIDVPAPVTDPLRETAPCPSPRLVAVLLEALALEPGQAVLVQGPGLAWLATVAGRIVAEQGRVVLVETDEALVEATGGLIREHAPDHVELRPTVASTDGARFDRALVLDITGAGDGDRVERSLAETSQLVHAGAMADGPDLVRTVHEAGQRARMHLGGTRVASLPDAIDAEASRSTGITVSEVLEVEALMTDAFAPHAHGPMAREIHEAVAETIGRALDARGVRTQDPVAARVAEGAFHAGYVLQMTGEADEAIRAYTASASVVETAEAYTFRGWTKSLLGAVQAAIEDCKHAIDVDPSLGNPYNDIGAYLLETGRAEDAIEWLVDVAEAERYASPQFPYLNLGRAYLELGDHEAARHALEEALAIDPGLEAAKRLLEHLDRDV